MPKKPKEISELGENLRSIREDADMTQKQLAKELGITFQSLSNYETGKTKIPMDVYIRFCRYFGCSLDAVAGLSEDDILYLTGLSQDERKSVKSVINCFRKK